jgi:serine/threonine protein kinase/WD40 repeat protein/tetratricopeptide (TPR) repeat protein
MTGGRDDPPIRDPVEELAEAFLERFRRGERPSVSEFVARAPEHAAEIRELFPALVLMEQAAPGADAIPAPAPACHLERLGDYRLIREVGRGGMGIVYEAEQEALGRHVALKILPFSAQTDARALARFRREARSAARLHHTNIVPVYDVGEREGVHYYAMQFIPGQGLDEVIAELRRLRRPTPGPAPPPTSDLSTSLAEGLLSGPAPGPDGSKASVLTDRSDFSTRSDFHFYRSVARIGLQVAEALAYAHGQRVLHRDIKPSNLLLDAQGCAWVTDFGLAKDEGDTLTGTGDVVGTLRYLAPERLSGVSDNRSDVYGLGLTLYELLTLRPAFAETDRVRLVQMITREEPAGPRKLDPHLPRDLETIVLTAIAKEPTRRYASAAALADDLRRFLADRPVRARRTSRWEHGWRWCRRNPGWATTAAAVLGLLVVISIGGTALSLHLRQALGDVRAADQVKADRLWQSHLERARALRSSGRVGQRFEALAAIREATKFRVTDELRDEAVAALVLPDVELDVQWDGCPDDTLSFAMDARFERYARINKAGEVTVCRRGPTGEEVTARVRAVGGPRYYGLWMSPDGRYLAYGHSSPDEGVAGSLRILRLDGPTTVVLPHEPKNVHLQAVAFHPDGRHLAVGDTGGTIGVYDLETNTPPRRWSIGEPANTLAFNPHDGRLAAACSESVRLFDGDTGRELPALKDADLHDWSGGLAWHPGGRLLAASGGDRKIHVWDTHQAAEAMAPLDGHPAAGIRMTYNQAGDRLLSTSWDRQTRLWDAVSGRLLLTLPGQYGTRFGPDGTTIGPGRDGTRLTVWRLADGRELRQIRRPRVEDRDQLHNPVLGLDERVLAASSSGGPVFFDFATGHELASVRLRNKFAETAYPRSFDRRDGWMTCGTTGAVLWPVSPDPERPGGLRVGPPRWLGPAGDVGADATPDGRVRVIPQRADHLDDSQAVVLDRDRPGRRVVLKPQHDIRLAAVSPDGTWAATCGWFWDGHSPSVRVWDAGTGRPVTDLPVGGQASASFSPDGKWLATHANEEGGHLWEVGTWRPVRRFANATFTWAPGGLFLVNDAPGAIRFVEPETGREVFRLTGAEATTYAPRCFSADGATLVTLVGDLSALWVWDLRSIRGQLRELGMDWELPEFPPAPLPAAPPVVAVDPGLLRLPTFKDDRTTVAVYGLAIALQPLHPDAYFLRAAAFDRQRATARALPDYEAFLVMAPKTDSRRPESLLHVAAISNARRDSTRALAALVDTLDLPADRIPFPDQYTYLCNAVAWRLASPRAARPPHTVLGLAEKAVERDPFNFVTQNTYGVVLYRLGRFADAVRCLEKNVDRSGRHVPFDLYFLAMCHQHLGRPGPARECFDRAVAAAGGTGFTLAERVELAAFRVEAEEVLRANAK